MQKGHQPQADDLFIQTVGAHYCLMCILYYLLLVHYRLDRV